MPEASAMQRQPEFDEIGADRRAVLDALAQEAVVRRRAGRAKLMFICTHNSRRSQLAQVWAHVWASRLELNDVEVYSGGTEVTAFAPGAIAALQRAGLVIEAEGSADHSTENPIYAVRAADDAPATRCFSKRIDDPSNPQREFIAVMTCSEADAACPHVAGAVARFALSYDDPKAFDGTEREAAAYDERCAQIARELGYVMARLARP